MDADSIKKDVRINSGENKAWIRRMMIVAIARMFMTAHL